jgi:hypothetical protein
MRPLLHRLGGIEYRFAVMDDDPPDTSPAVRWLSYAALAQARGIGRASAERLARRKRWQRMAANDGSTLVRVPEDEATLSPDDPVDVPGEAG